MGSILRAVGVPQRRLASLGSDGSALVLLTAGSARKLAGAGFSGFGEGRGRPTGDRGLACAPLWYRVWAGSRADRNLALIERDFGGWIARTSDGDVPSVEFDHLRGNHVQRVLDCKVDGSGRCISAFGSASSLAAPRREEEVVPIPAEPPALNASCIASPTASSLR
jgi:hypothetical protein